MNPNLLEAQRKLVPEMMEILHQRYRLLKFIGVSGPIGRRPLSIQADISERECRNLMEALRNEELIRIAKEGATITYEGSKVLELLAPSIEEWTGQSLIASKLSALLKIRSVQIVPGNCDVNPTVKSLIGKEAATVFMQKIENGKVIAVTGGSSVAAIPQHIHSIDNPEQLHFIAARGGVGDDIGLQANVIAASFAEASGGTYSTFYYPESLSQEAHEIFKREPSVIQMMEQYAQTDCVLHGIGDAERMAELRNTPENEKQLIREKEAKGEAFGYYFDENGEVVHRIRTVGIQTEQLEQVPLIIAVAGGVSKADAILSYMESAPRQTILVTDEGAAHAILEKLEDKQ
ncbi:sugar-binding domain-containing protein [Sporosarcina thermotolerans]|uniref:Sugar-binding domain-containing protein n=1 Tax=Sporosarcina thermotolerans TaxID=633404 RepID=A0AAW9AB55_9BACL|nr:sugar-binding domain-containing protein [Sporosarcina thermotolerans]MDW0118417.1 sugar-binding domain-containing protein [Sporosarcina thermotolerans]